MKSGIDSDGWLKTYQPDVILLHIGTNDIREGDAALAPGNLSALLDDILARLPQAHVIVVQIISFRRGPDQGHQSYNAAIPGIVASKGPRVSMVDMQNTTRWRAPGNLPYVQHSTEYLDRLDRKGGTQFTVPIRI
jgi:hypothetical protein